MVKMNRTLGPENTYISPIPAIISLITNYEISIKIIMIGSKGNTD